MAGKHSCERERERRQREFFFFLKSQTHLQDGKKNVGFGEERERDLSIMI